MEIETTILEEDFYDLEEKEWPGVRENTDCITRIDPKLFIMELGRLVPVVREKHVRFFPLNMPNITIGCIHLIGLILEVSDKYPEFTVDDGTGVLTINLKPSPVLKESQDEAQISRDNPENINIQTIKGLLPGGYVYLQGFFSLNYKRAYENCTEPNHLIRLKYGQPVFFATNLQVISEKQYYEKMCIWFNSASSRYTSIT